MRSFSEIRFRLQQEAANAWLYLFPPTLPPALRAAASFPAALLPEGKTVAAKLRETPYAAELNRLAAEILQHRFPLLGYVIETGPAIRWRRDPLRGIESETAYFRRIPYLDAARAGDHKIIWELNRHQHLVLLSKAWLLTGKRECLSEIASQLESWHEQNPYGRGINWASALEVAFRALSWIWIYHLAGDALPGRARDLLLNGLYQHGVHLRHNLSVYFSPNTHLLGEAVALHALGVLFPRCPQAGLWKKLGGEIVAAEMENQVRPDGAHFEQSSAYHVYAVDLFLFHSLLEPPSQAYRDKLSRMVDYLAAITSDDGRIPHMGDDDGGSLFHPYGERRRFGMATLTSCGRAHEDMPVQAAWWLGDRAFSSTPPPPNREPRLFPDTGVAVLSSGPVQVVADTRGFGHAGAGHSHAHALQVLCRDAGRDLLIDPGTYTYVGEPEWRDRFRGTAAHNTVRVDGKDQADPAGPFRWLNKPSSEVLRWTVQGGLRYLAARCLYRGMQHERHFLWMEDHRTLVVVDEVSGSGGGSHLLEQFWHCGAPVTSLAPGLFRIGDGARLAVPAVEQVELIEGWLSEAPGSKVERPVVRVTRQQAFPAAMGALLQLRPEADLRIEVTRREQGIHLSAGRDRTVEFLRGGGADPTIVWK